MVTLEHIRCDVHEARVRHRAYPEGIDEGERVGKLGSRDGRVLVQEPAHVALELTDQPLVDRVPDDHVTVGLEIGSEAAAAAAEPTGSGEGA